jgi:hypothetical protein
MGCCFSKKQHILLETSSKPEIGQYVDISEFNINYSNPIHSNKFVSDNVTI